MDRERFEWLVAKALEVLPEEFVVRLENITVVVEDQPTPRQLVRARLKRGQTLFGLYEGVPLTRRGAHYGLVVPDKITIFQGPIESACRDDAEITAQIQRVVQHEIAIFSDNIPDAEKYLSELRELDQVFFYNRRGTLRYKQERYKEALEDVEKAYDSDYPTLDIRVQRIILMIILDIPQAEEEILKIEGILGDRSDVVRGLRCNYYLQKGQWAIANQYWQQIWQKELPSFKELRRVILELKKGDMKVPVPERKEAKTELSKYLHVVKLPIVNPDIEEM